ncbi:MAG: hypothetical protein AMQ74_00903 [Candidatus Methanofastidiosum methylothiophilum]|uniref:Uncharacterized protein n=1 Tax=Candidatus Methanofastidiosum methylothiophilum TaxID=1705564 RepID=A0A150J4C3_9EURY|nr:MAG: hypothetical protein AMQ74_00903 [Candidatus Methanofastidiosum methylthiophilus]NMC77152.1 hypothetical protein [Candidatus Methanofastidiosa archaeon]
MKKIFLIFFILLFSAFVASAELTSLIVPLNDSDIPKGIRPLIKEGYRIYFQGFDENLMEFICNDEASASLLLNEFINSKGGYTIQDYSNYSYKGIKGFRYVSPWGKGYALQNKNKVYIFSSPSGNESNIRILLENKFGKEFPYYYLAFLVIPIGIVLYKLRK